jgi:8-oxo-dGTP diphosphatase
MHIDPRLNEIDDCLYRVAVKALIVQKGKVLLVQEIPEMWWGFPGGGIDYGEELASSLVREVVEELGVPSREVISDFLIAYYNIGNVVKGIPRMNLFFKVALPKAPLKKTDHIAKWKWFTRDEFMKLSMSPSFKDRSQLAKVIFDN